LSSCASARPRRAAEVPGFPTAAGTGGRACGLNRFHRLTFRYHACSNPITEPNFGSRCHADCSSCDTGHHGEQPTVR
jgi:hypothetical protein